MSPFLIYNCIFFFSFNILALQVLLATFLTTAALSPFLAVSFAFLGLTMAGIWVAKKYPQNDYKISQQEILGLILSLAFLLMLCPLAIKYFTYSQQTRNLPIYDNTCPYALGNIIGNSIFIGLIFSLIFFFAGKFYALIYKYYVPLAPKIYFFDLAGASLGCLFPIILLNFLQLSSVLILMALFSFVFALFIIQEGPKNIFLRNKIIVFTLCCFVYLICNILTSFLEASLKEQIWNKDTYTEIWHRWNVYSKTSLLKINHPENKENTYAFSIISGGAFVYPYNPADPCAYKLFEKYSPASIGFLSSPAPRDILVLLAGAGYDMVLADSYSCGKADITGVELNPLIVQKAKEIPGYNLTSFFGKKNIHLVIAEARSYVESTDKKFDSIIISFAGATAVQYLGIDSYTAQYLYTKEAFKSYLKHLKPNGTIAVVSFNKLKIAATVKAAFQDLGYSDITKKMVLMDKRPNIAKSYSQDKLFAIGNFMPLLIKNTDFTRQDIKKMQPLLHKMDLDWLYNPYYTHKDFKIFEYILKSDNIAMFLKNLNKKYDQNFTIIRDDSPFIFNAFQIRSFFSLNFMRDLINYSWLKNIHTPLKLSGILLMFLMGTMGLYLLIGPLTIKNNTTALNKFRRLSYFIVIGLGFIFTEIAVMHAFTLLLGNPIYSFSIVLLSLLLSTATGALISQHLFDKGLLNLKRLSALTCFILILDFLFIPKIGTLLYLNFPIRLVETFALIIPLGACLGMFFPQGLKKFFGHEKALIPWVWGLNGYMSIIGSCVSIYVCRVEGFSFLLLISALLYLLIFLIVPD